MNKHSSIFVAGGETLLGSALLRLLQLRGFKNVLGAGEDLPDLRDDAEVDEFFARERPEYVFHAAGLAGGIRANQRYPGDLCEDNLAVNLHVISAAQRHCATRLLYVASSCCYPKFAPQPLAVESLWTGPLEPTNHAYAAAKLAGIALCQAYRAQYGCDFVTGIAANCYGPGDSFDSHNSHVVGALLARMHEARENGEPSVTVWGSGEPRREFLFVDDLASACVHVMQHAADFEIVNLAGGPTLSIAELAERVKLVTGYEGELTFDTSRPDGMPLKSLDAAPLLATGWRPQFDFDRGLVLAYEWFQEHCAETRLAHA